MAAWQTRNFSGSSSAFGGAAAAWWWRQQQWCVGGGSMAYADNNFNHHDDNNDLLLIVPSLWGRGEGGGEINQVLIQYWRRRCIRSSTMSVNTLILCQIILKCMIWGLSACFLPWKDNFSSGIRLLQLNIISFLIHCPTYHIFGWLLMSHKKCLISKVFLELIHGIPWSFFVLYINV